MVEQSQKKIVAENVMTRKVVSISPDASLFEAAKLISEHHFDGVPVADKDGKLIGIITEYDLILKTSGVNATFLQKILNEVYAKKEGKSHLGEALSNGAKEISLIKVSDIMNKEPLSLRESSGFEEIISAFTEHHKVNPIPIVDENNILVGIISRFDVLRPLNLIGYGAGKHN